MTYDLTTPDIQCHADKEGASVYEVEVIGWNDNSDYRRKVYRVMARDPDNALDAAQDAFSDEFTGFFPETAELL